MQIPEKLNEMLANIHYIFTSELECSDDLESAIQGVEYIRDEANKLLNALNELEGN